jgi:AcrR family transcriptional regulator
LAGVSPAAPYRHFANKDALLAAVAEEGFRRLSRALQQAAGQAGDDPVLRFQRMGIAYVQVACGHASQYSLMFGRGGPDKGRFATLDAAADDAFELLVGAVAECQTAGLIRPADPKNFALAAWALMHGLATLAIEGQLDQALSSLGGLDQVAEMVAAALFEGLRHG